MAVEPIRRPFLLQAVIFLVTFAVLAVLAAKAPLALLLADRFVPGAGWVQAALLGIYAAWIGGRLLDSRRAARTRLVIWLLFSCVFFLQLALGLAGVGKVLMTGQLHLPIPALIIAGPLYRGDGLFMPILFVSTVLLVGPAWCSHLCYFGAWDALAASRRRRAGRLPPWSRLLRFATPALAAAGGLVLRFAGAPRGAPELLAVSFAAGGVAVMVILSRKTGTAVHCTSYCPIGLTAGIMGKLSPWRLRISPGCTYCGKCAVVCRYDALKPGDLERGRPGLTCTLCGDCLAPCEKGLIHFTLYGRVAAHPGAIRAAFVVLVTVLHAVFLGVARI